MFHSPPLILREYIITSVASVNCRVGRGTKPTFSTLACRRNNWGQSKINVRALHKRIQPQNLFDWKMLLCVSRQLILL